MSYTKHNFTDGSILTAAQLNGMDDQIASNEAALADKAASAAVSALAERVTANENAIADKADASDLAALEEAVDGKAAPTDLTDLRDAMYPIGIIILGDTQPVSFGTWTEIDIGLTDTSAWKRTA